MRINNSVIFLRPTITQNNGFTLIEVLIAFIILTVGLLGIVALQISAKQANYNADQRSAAFALAHDIVERIRANDTTEAVAKYNTTLSHNSPLTAHNCLNNACSSMNMAAYDLDQWRKALRMADNTGILANGVVCISAEQSSDSRMIELQVVVAWQGRQKIKPVTNKDINCGSFSDRRAVVLNSHIFIRSA
jgi:type IV pilus assembly protein PilV